MTEADDVLAVSGLVQGAWRAMCLRAMVDLGIPDLLDGPTTVEQLGTRADADPVHLVRLLRVLADLGLVARDASGHYVLTARGALLRSSHPGDLRSLALTQTWPLNIAAWGGLADAVRSGDGTFEQVHGTSMWEALSRNPQQEAVFNAAMARRGALQAATLADACDLSGVEKVVDVGGGSGALLEALLGAEPRLRGVVADRPDVAAEAERRMAAAGLGERCEVAAADFFREVPGGGDAYVLSNILHDWPDEDCVRILGVVRAAMRPGARLWVLERVLDPTPPRPPTVQADLHLLDLNMFVMFGARERTEGEYAALLTASGFDRPVVHTTPVLDVIEAVRG